MKYNHDSTKCSSKCESDLELHKETMHVVWLKKNKITVRFLDFPHTTMAEFIDYRKPVLNLKNPSRTHCSILAKQKDVSC